MYVSLALAVQFTTKWIRGIRIAHILSVTYVYTHMCLSLCFFSLTHKANPNSLFVDLNNTPFLPSSLLYCTPTTCLLLCSLFLFFYPLYTLTLIQCAEELQTVATNLSGTSSRIILQCTVSTPFLLKWGQEVTLGLRVFQLTMASRSTIHALLANKGKQPGLRPLSVSYRLQWIWKVTCVQTFEIMFLCRFTFINAEHLWNVTSGIYIWFIVGDDFPTWIQS